MVNGLWVSVPMKRRLLHGLYYTEKEELHKFIRAGRYNFDCLRRDYLNSDQIEVICTMLKNLNQPSQWELVYLVLEIENSGESNKELYPFSLWSLLGKEVV